LGLDVAAVVRQTRVMSAAMSRIAETIGDEVVAGLAEARREGVSDDEIAEGLTQWIDPERMEKLLGYFYRRQLRAALWRKLAVPGAPLGDHTETVGFVDLVRFTAITEEIAEDELDALISRFEEVAHDVITGNGSRMVKMIGDEVMFVADDPFEGTKVALELVEAYADDPQLPTARAGVATGGVLARDGDYYGPVVNLASRIVDVARPGHVVTSEALHDALSDHEGLIWRRVPPKRLKGIGLTRLWSVRRG
jgi:adenylate cyclase